MIKNKSKKKTRPGEQSQESIFSTPNFKIFLRTISILALGLTAVLIICIGQQTGFHFRPLLQEGDIASRAIYADRDFSYVSKERTEAKKQELCLTIKDIYDLDHKAVNGSLKNINSFFSSLRQLPKDVDILKLKAIDMFGLNETNLKWFNELGRKQEISFEIIEILKRVANHGILSLADRQGLIRRNITGIVVKDLNNNTESHKDMLGLLTLGSAKSRVLSEVMSSFPEERRLRLAVTELLQVSLIANLKYNVKETEARRAKIKESAPLEYDNVKQGELIINRGQRVTCEHLDKLWQSGQEERQVGKIPFFIGVVFMTAICLGLAIFYLKMFHNQLYHSPKYLILIGSLTIIILLLSKAVLILPISIYLIPAGFMAMMIAIMINSQIALVVAAFVSILIAVMAGGKLELFSCCLIGSLTGIYMVQEVRRRFHLLRAGLFVGLANFVSIMSFSLINNLEYELMLKEGMWGIAGGLMSVFLVMSFLPIFEHIFKITTDISLLELCDLNHPILKKLLLEAPGTYHHSLLVGNLSESAADAVGAKALLVRAGSYYHDIGKIDKSEYFDENQKDDNKHDKLSPSMSSLIISNHVKDGVETARKFKLHKVIIDIIRQHHGTSLVQFFYQRALEQNEREGRPEQVSEESFRYPGPRPQTKEAAIILLSDSAEAASRALSDPTPASIRGVVQKVINNKFIDGQLDECDLTLKDLHKIADTFVYILTGIYHSRAAYQEDNKRKTVKGNGKNKKPPKKN
ncbi:MAG: HDIG domain-containing protein [Candidatus Omnitrophica bacterium]|nr:HDIG domain-containing protein [Candidatus Omnitrophota bacterium]